QIRLKQTVGRAAQLVNRARRNLAIHVRELGAHAFKQVGAADAIGKTGIIVGQGNQACPAVAGIDQQDIPVESAQINGGGESGGPATDDEAIQNLCRHRPLTMSWVEPVYYTAP